MKGKTKKPAKTSVIDQEGKPVKPHLFVKGGGPNHPHRPSLMDAFIERIGVEREKRIFEHICREADNGNWEAVTFLAERIYAKKKPSMSIRSSIREIINLADIEAANTVIIAEVANGDLTVEGGMP
jgi:hypothetical protein